MASVPKAHRSSQCGGITILVALSLLVLLSISAIGMSRNSLREVIISGTERQGVEVRNTADSGLEWAIYWLNESNRTARVPDAGALALIANLDSQSANPDSMGQMLTLNTVSPSAMSTTINNVERSYAVRSAWMGQLEMPMVSQTPGVIVQNPLLWNFRADATLDYGGMSFQHSKESWVVAPPPGAAGNN